MPPLVSVVIPAYNSETNLAETLLSVLRQDYKSIEIILVDDASSDQTAAVAEDVLKKGNRAWRIVRHERNSGISSARNTGLRNAQGDYVWFMDHDDIADADFVSTLLRMAVENDCDVTFSQHRFFYEATGEYRDRYISVDASGNYSADDVTEMYLLGKMALGIWTMLYKTEFIRSIGLEFTEGCTSGEDGEFILKAFSRSRKTMFTDRCLYTYRVHNKMTSGKYSDSPEKMIASYKDSTEAALRSMNDAVKYVKSPSLLDLIKHWYIPKLRLKMFNIYAWEGDRETFDRFRKDPETRATLLTSRKAFSREPQIFLKTLALLAFPNAYYKYRNKHVYGFKIKLSG